MKAIVKTNLQLPGQTAHYVGKVRDVYSIEGVRKSRLLWLDAVWMETICGRSV